MINVWILGPCSIENAEMYISVGKHLATLMGEKDWYLKASFDKANRSSIDGKRGPGLEESLKIFQEVKQQIPGVKLTTDVHETWQVEKLAGLIDCIQIPAFLCRQTDLIVESARHFPVVNIKKGQWMSPQNMVKGVDKIKNINPDVEAWITERGTQFGYTQLIVDFAAPKVLGKVFDKVLLDCTHSTQRLKPNGRTGGDRDLAEKYLLTAGIFGYDGVFSECHPDPPSAVSDGDSQIELHRMKTLLEAQARIEAVHASTKINPDFGG